jgi:hypothetical protein
MPKSPTKFAKCLQDLHSKASPRKQAALKGMGFNSPHHAQLGMVVERMAESLKKSRSKSSNHARQILLAICKEAHRAGGSSLSSLPFSYKALCQETTKTMKKERMKEKEIVEFFNSAATTLPSKKNVSKKSGVASSVLQKPLQELHKEFLDTTGHQVSFAHFAFCRPQHIRPARRNFLRQCLCEYCENVSLKVNAVNRLAARMNNRCRIRHAFHAVDLVTCGRTNGKWNHSCAMRTCEDCKPGTQLDDHLAPLPAAEFIKWQRWENKVVTVRGKEVSKVFLICFCHCI